MNTEFTARRILVIGSSGAGKSTLSAVLSKALGIEVVYLDRHFYQPEWKGLPQGQWREEVTRLTAKDEWIMDGDFSDTFDIRFPRADTVIDLAYSRYRCAFQALTRLAFAVKEGRSDLPAGCRESFDLSLLRWIWSYPEINRPRIAEALRKWGGHISYLKFTSPRELNVWLERTITG